MPKNTEPPLTAPSLSTYSHTTNEKGISYYAADR